MANVFLNIPVPTSDGAGAAVDVSAMGKTKSLVIGGGFRATVNVEYAIGDTPTDWAPLATFLQAGNLTIDVACQWIRAVTSDYVSGTPNLDVGSNDGVDRYVIGSPNVGSFGRFFRCETGEADVDMALYVDYDYLELTGIPR